MQVGLLPRDEAEVEAAKLKNARCAFVLAVPTILSPDYAKPPAAGAV